MPRLQLIILLQNRLSKEYFRPPNRWTAALADAHQFPSAMDAYFVMEQLRMSDVDIVWLRPGQLRVEHTITDPAVIDRNTEQAAGSKPASDGAESSEKFLLSPD